MVVIVVIIVPHSSNSLLTKGKLRDFGVSGLRSKARKSAG